MLNFSFMCICRDYSINFLLPCPDLPKLGEQHNFIFKENSNSEFRFTSQYDVTFTQLVNIEKITRIIIIINGINVFDGLSLTSSLVFKANDVIKVKIYKTSKNENYNNYSLVHIYWVNKSLLTVLGFTSVAAASTDQNKSTTFL